VNLKARITGVSECVSIRGLTVHDEAGRQGAKNEGRS